MAQSYALGRKCQKTGLKPIKLYFCRVNFQLLIIKCSLEVLNLSESLEKN